MKKTIITVVAILFSITTFAKEVPKAVKEAFAKKFATATNVKWDKENAHEYEAGFIMDGKSYSANFSDTGEWLETESAIEYNALPQKVQVAFTAAHKTAKVKAAAKIETAKGETKYEVEFKNGKKTKEEFYTAEGVVIS
jgi:hypothetical protein